jgi:DNA-binding FrmR family transcriptional regulator
MQASRNVKARKSSKPAASCPAHASGSHMSHLSSLPRLKRIRGQMEGIERMISEQRYCMDILMQIKAARSALQALEGEVLGTHLEGCVREAITAKDPVKADKKIKELLELLNR